MVYKNLSDARRHGIYYTPPHLASFLVKPLVNRANLSVFDPAYGEGALLLAAEEMIRRNKKSSTNRLTLYGCDRAPVNGLLKHFPRSHLMEMDFFDYSSENKFDVIVMNPPFVRHHLIVDEKRQTYQKIVAEICRLKWSSDLWAYFLVKSCLHLRKGGNIGAILPWSFLQADYAQDIRMWLSDKFEEIQALALNAEYFNDAQERVVLLWLKNYGFSLKSLRISFSQHLSDDARYYDITKEKWNAQSIIFSSDHDISSILSMYIDDFNFQQVEEFASVKIGVVTGADNYFILTEEDAKKYSFSKKHLVPIFTSSTEFSGLYLNGYKPIKNLIALPSEGCERFKEYIMEGVKSRYHLRAHSVRREPWYLVDQGEVPDAFFPYRMSRIPYVVLNDQSAQCTNSIHRIYFKESLSQCEKRWLQISLLSVPGQLSLETYSKTYGSVLKIEPKSLKASIAFISKERSVNSIYGKVSKLLASGRKDEAMMQATDFINKELAIPNELSLKAHSALIELQNRRLRR
jgi:adenine-specific DNA methylase